MCKDKDYISYIFFKSLTFSKQKKNEVTQRIGLSNIFYTNCMYVYQPIKRKH